ncbi:CYTH domain-containing protein [Paraburkholderia bonniea]|uniref:CYTH domain-containing protein n=1 Tax=Paraburkholderia bonniea TaxID=2152891 RepID=UPI0012908BD3|nr:CYTH domain-containing protein [Paraburkholderia bonniea]WJF90634.1 CYTH domain-containing protein [Paraburkholderia bonniea]WJF93949.1 CYTH domain-containing protein [Paraburkholderia bonniea]
MAIECEIKLALPAAHVDAATQWFTAHSASPGREFLLGNSYFDTPGLLLARAKSALRLRQTPDGWLQTYKTLGVAQSGLHQRHEWELPVASRALELTSLLLACDDIDAAAALRQAQNELIELFQTRFTRMLWCIEHRGATVEAVIDQGEVSAEVDGETRCAPICEIELELKQGNAAALHQLATKLTACLPGVAPDNISKAQRGYQLRER